MGPVDNKFIQLLLRRMPTVASASRHLSSLIGMLTKASA